MRRFTSLKIAAVVITAILPMGAQAAVTYDFVVTTGWPTGSSFSLTVANPITANASFDVAQLTTCNAVNPANPTTICKVENFYINPTYTNLAFGIGFPDIGGTSYLNYHFELDAFSTNGVHAGATEGDASRATLTVSGITAPAVPEPANWALMIGGLALAGAALRRRPMSICFATA